MFLKLHSDFYKCFFQCFLLISVLCVFLGEGHVGGVVFEERGRSLEFIEDCPEQKPFLNTSSLVHSLSPSTVLVKKGNKARQN